MPAAFALSVLLGLLALFQAALALGAPWGRLAWGGRHRVLPAALRVGSLSSIVIYALIGAAAWARAGAIPGVPAGLSHVAMWVVVGYFCLGVVMNGASRSRVERNTMVPVCLVLATVSLLVALGVGDSAAAA